MMLRFFLHRHGIIHFENPLRQRHAYALLRQVNVFQKRLGVWDFTQAATRLDLKQWRFSRAEVHIFNDADLVVMTVSIRIKNRASD